MAHYLRPATNTEALAALARPGAAPLGGGTDLLVTIKDQIAHPDQLVDVRHLPGAGEITLRADGSARLGAAVRIADIAAHPGLHNRFGALTAAARVVGTPALRNMGTLAGSLAQRPRCWYFRRGVGCFKNGGDGCPAVTGENQYHAIFGTGTCRAVHPSDPAVALSALEATVEILGAANTSRTVTIEAFFAGAANNPHGETALAPGELIAAIELPATSASNCQHYAKLMQRGAWDFALVSLAAVRRADGEVRLVLGGVAAAPFRVNQSVEEDVQSGGLDEDSLDALAERALYDAAPLSKNAYKVTQARALLRDAMRTLSAAAP